MIFSVTPMRPRGSEEFSDLPAAPATKRHSLGSSLLLRFSDSSPAHSVCVCVCVCMWPVCVLECPITCVDGPEWVWKWLCVCASMCVSVCTQHVCGIVLPQP